MSASVPRRPRRPVLGRPLVAGLLGSLGLILGGALPVVAKGPAYTDAESAGLDYQIQGEYRAMLPAEDGPRTIALQVVALGDGAFDAVAYTGGLPGDGWNGEDPIHAPGKREGETAVFQAPDVPIKGVWSGGGIDVVGPDGAAIARFDRVERTSPTLGAKPPAGAVVLFDGTNADAFPGAKTTGDGLLAVPATSKQAFGDHSLHLEFRTPFMPTERGQARGNSGVYLQGRYEAQVLDSFGLKGESNEAGGIYEVRAPLVNACLPPLVWQTYDIDFTAAKHGADGELTAPPKVTVRLNGLVVQQDTVLPGATATRAAPAQPGAGPGPLYLQDHGDPVVYRNIWVVEK